MTPHFALSTWSIHGLLGQARFRHDDGAVTLDGGEANGDVSLLELPAIMANRGLNTLEICHFHLPSLEDAYLAELKQQLEEHDVTVENILVDDGNISSPDEAVRHASIELAKRYQIAAVKLGAKGNRIDCGLEVASAESKANAVAALKALSENAVSLGLHLCVENFHPTSNESDDLLEIMSQVAPKMKLCVDFGNADFSAEKFTTLSALMPHATSIHCKAAYIDDAIDTDDLHRCLDIMTAANFNGPISLIYGETENEWEGLKQLQDAVEAYCA